MKIEETYIIHHVEFIKVDWLLKEIFSHFPESITGHRPSIYIVTIHKMSNGKWYFEFPTISYGNSSGSITVHASIREFNTELTPEMIEQLNS